MKIIPIYFTSIFFLLVLNVGVIFAQTIPQQTLSLKDLTFTIATTKQVFLPLEPIPLVMTVKNNTSNPITAYISLEFRGKYTKVFVQQSEDTEIELEYYGLLSPFFGKIRKVMPDEEITNTDQIDYGLSDQLSNPGNYQIQAEFCNHNFEGCIRSQSLLIAVAKPQGQDLLAYNFIKATPDSNMFFIYQKDLKHMEDFVSKFQITPYSDYILEKIGDTYSFNKKYDAAITSYEKISPQFAFAERIKKRITDAKKAIADARKELEADQLKQM